MDTLQSKRIRIAAFVTTMFFLYLPVVLSASEQETEEDPWQFTGFFSQQLNQISFSDWVQGGENSFASTSIVNLGAQLKKNKLNWDNRLNMSYGIIKIEDTPVRKNEDRIRLLSKFGREFSEHFSTSFLGEFRSQFDKAYKYPNDSVLLSRFMAPGYLSLSLGIDYEPWEFLSIFVSPASGKFTFVRDQELANRGSFGVDPAIFDEDGVMISEGSRTNAEFGALLNIMFKKEVFEDVEIDSKLTLFNDLTDEDKSKRKNTDIDWETSINLKINRYITASFLIHILYDDDIPIPVYDQDGVQTGYTRGFQAKQMIGIGLSYRI